ncbi:hypothetical protein [Streptomyces sp. CS113]|uniref:hypothetical protein n=1 Tax=Streptomyces sp. CS113 TaxID=1982761 RepID=UPI00211B27A9|nr:hypothetical protein [Streptomyces sp. CS113]
MAESTPARSPVASRSRSRPRTVASPGLARLLAAPGDAPAAASAAARGSSQSLTRPSRIGAASGRPRSACPQISKKSRP